MRNVKKPLAISLLLAASVAANAEIRSNQAPSVVSSSDAMQVVCVPSDNAGCEQSIGIASDRSYLWVGTAVQENTEIGESQWRVTDRLVFPGIAAGRDFSDVMCRYREQFDQSIVAVVATGSDEWLKAVDWAFRVNPVSGRFESLDPSDVDCYNENAKPGNQMITATR